MRVTEGAERIVKFSCEVPVRTPDGGERADKQGATEGSHAPESSESIPCRQRLLGGVKLAPAGSSLVFARRMAKPLHMQRSFILKGAGILVGIATALSAQPNVDVLAREVAALRNDVNLLNHRVGELTGTIDDLRRDNAQLQSRANQNYVTVAQLNEAIAEMNRTLQAGLASNKREVLAQVATQMERLGRQTQGALDAIAKGLRPASRLSALR